MSANLQISREERVLQITLNNPMKRNALTFSLCSDLVTALNGADRDPLVGAIVLTAAGDVFSAGMDLDEALAPNASEHARIHEELFTIGRRMTKPIVAAVSGPALAGGLGLVANAHIAIAVQGAKFGLTEIRIGMWPFLVYRAVADAVGSRRALELSLTGRIFGTQEALEWGLIHSVAPAFEFEDRVRAVASSLTSASAEVIRSGLAFVNETRCMDWQSAGVTAARYRAEAFRSPDFVEGVQAFREKRPPKWPSHG